jgi:hypothetical protein
MEMVSTHVTRGQAASLITRYLGVKPHAHQLKNSELPQNEKNDFVLKLQMIFALKYFSFFSC